MCCPRTWQARTTTTTISVTVVWYCYLLLFLSKAIIKAQALASEKVGFKSQLHHYNPGASYVTSLCLNFPVYKMGMSHRIIRKITI